MSNKSFLLLGGFKAGTALLAVLEALQDVKVADKIKPVATVINVFLKDTSKILNILFASLRIDLIFLLGIDSLKNCTLALPHSQSRPLHDRRMGSTKVMGARSSSVTRTVVRDGGGDR